jgi:hypothetical protein
MIERRRLIGLGVAAGLALGGGLGSLGSATVQAEDDGGTGRLEGRVVGDDGALLAGATVTVTSPELDSGDATLQTDGQGQFTLGALRPGLYDLAVEQDGYRAGALASLSVQDGQATRAEIVLQRRASGDGGY